MDSTYSKDQWLITSAGSEALSAARNWIFQIDQIISQDKEEYDQHAIVIGRLLAGSMAFFGEPGWNAFTITRNDAPLRAGWVNNVRPTDDPTGG